MKEERIIRALNDVDDIYILEAMPERKIIKHISWKKWVCVAACLILLIALSTVAYANNWFGIRDLLLPLTHQSHTGETEETDIIGLSGYQGSAEWQALAEWMEFVNQYDPEGKIYQASEGRLDSSFARYSCYLVYSGEMADKMDSIVEKYGLKLHTTSYDLQEHLELVEALGDFLGSNDAYFSYMYEDGTFEAEGTIEFLDIGVWDFQLLRSVKGTFHDTMLEVGDISQYQETAYETACGVAVTLALGEDRALVFADLADSFVTVTIPYGLKNGLEQVHLQILADSIDFTALTPVILPQTGGETTQPAEAEQDMEVRKIYAATLRNLLYSSILPDGTDAEFPVGEYSQFAVGDVDYDGREELVILYDPGVMAAAEGYILGCDKDTEEIYIQLEEFPAFTFLSNGNVKALSSHNQTYGDMWPYILYQYVQESDTYELTGYVHSEDKAILELNGQEDQYPYAVDVSGAGTVYYIGADSWGTEPVDERDYISWLDSNHGNVRETEVSFLTFTEENIAIMEQ